MYLNKNAPESAETIYWCFIHAINKAIVVVTGEYSVISRPEIRISRIFLDFQTDPEVISC